MENKRLKDLVVRTISGAVLLLVVVGALMWSKWSVGALFATIMIGGLVEFYRLCEKGGARPMRSIGLASAVALFGMAFTVFLHWGAITDITGKVFLALLLYFMLLVPSTFVCELWRKHPTPMVNIASTIMGVVYLALPMALVLFIPQLLVGKWSAWALLSVIAIIWVNDISAYLVGVTFGKHRLCERISPKKSWEGFFGGLIGAVAVAVLFGHLAGGSLLVWGGLGLVASLSGVAGDLVESLFKREVDVKDSGKMMPGHGGFLDRFDALYIAVPYVFVYLLLVGHFM